MLKTMRDSFHQLKWTLYAVIIVFILGFVYFVGSGSGSPDSMGQVAARIGSESISAAEFDRQYRATLQQQQRLYQGNLSPELIRALDLPRQVLEGMIERRLRLEAARRLHLKVSDDEVSNRIVTMAELQKDGQFIGKEKYEELLRVNGLSAERFEEEVREGLQLDKYSTLLKSTVVVPDSEIQREFSLRNEKASIEYIKIPMSRLESAGEPAEADLKAYYDKHRDRYRAPEQRRIKYLLVDRARIRAKLIIPEPELQAEYQRRRESFAVPEKLSVAHILIKVDASKGPDVDAQSKARAEKLLARLKKGEDFTKLADESTEDPSGKGNGGQLPPFARGQMVPEFDQAAFDMTEGDIRGPIKTSYGYHILKLLKKIPAHTRPFAEVRGEISAELAERRAQAETERKARELAERIQQLKSSSDEVLRKLQDGDVVSYNTTEWISRGEAIAGIGANARLSDEAWRLKIGEVSKTPVTTTRGPAFVKPTEERPAGVAPFAEIKSRVAQDFQTERRQKEALEKLKPAANELASGAMLSSLAARYETEVKTTPEFGPGGPIPEVGTAPELSAAVFRTSKGKAGPPVAVPGGFVLFRVLSRTTPDAVAFESQRAEILESLRSREAERLARSYLQQIRSDRRVEINEEVLKALLPESSTKRRG